MGQVLRNLIYYRIGASATPTRMDHNLSVYLNFLRLFAALSVFAGHITTEILKFTGIHFHDAAVIVFFVMSGLVIAHTSSTKDRNLKDYLFARLARLWSVVIPAVIVSVVLWIFGPRLAPHAFYFAAPGFGEVVKTTLAALTFTNETSFDRHYLPTDWPFWSISYEFVYYLLWGLTVYLTGIPRIIGLAVISVLAGRLILLLFPIWLLGVAVYRLRSSVSPSLGWLLLVGSTAGYVVLAAGFGLPAGHDKWRCALGVIVAANILGFSAISPTISLKGAGLPIGLLAGGTFSLYLFHAPLILFFNAVLPQTLPVPTRVAAIVIFTLGLIAIITPFTEGQKGRVRRILERISPLQREPPVETDRASTPATAIAHD
jgi:peptidoglycan/LPS O-acetylase OafA/YrhL